ncbi:hypothetical protein KO500_01120 [Cellulophaga baltica]|nr:DUF6702 family protein [Cellulophaga sp. 1_MG-2023]MBU2995009.1 hypothetical protein [Cellulophaga baltica]MDO6766404.1 hypothetical protein [Cellulophaga sp. 1_MG-2023]
MNFFKKSIILVLLPLFAFTTAHKFYVSVTNIAYSSKDNALQITSRVFIDDLEQTIKERYDINLHMATDKELQNTTNYIEKYINTKFSIAINGNEVPVKFIGKEYDNDIVVCYIEVPNVKLSEVKNIEISNEMLFDMYDDQKNVVHFKLNDHKKSYVLTRSNNKGMLNL